LLLEKLNIINLVGVLYGIY